MVRAHLISTHILLLHCPGFGCLPPYQFSLKASFVCLFDKPSKELNMTVVFNQSEFLVYMEDLCYKAQPAQKSQHMLNAVFLFQS